MLDCFYITVVRIFLCSFDRCRFCYVVSRSLFLPCCSRWVSRYSHIVHQFSFMYMMTEMLDIQIFRSSLGPPSQIKFNDYFFCPSKL